MFGPGIWCIKRPFGYLLYLLVICFINKTDVLTSIKDIYGNNITKLMFKYHTISFNNASKTIIFNLRKVLGYKIWSYDIKVLN